MAGQRLRVLIAGGGVAGLEALTALRALAGDRVELMQIAPENEFVYRPLNVEAHYRAGRTHRVPLKEVARDNGAGFSSSTVVAVDTASNSVTTANDEQFGYDALVLAAGADALPVVERAFTWDDRAESEMLGGFIEDFEAGYSSSLAVIIPPGPGWPLRGYEAAVLITRSARGVGVETETYVIEPPVSPLDAVGNDAKRRLGEELKELNIKSYVAESVAVEHGSVMLRPQDLRLKVDRVLALPELRGRPVEGIPSDDQGFVHADDHGRVRGLEMVWAAGDITSFPAKSGGFASEQADVVAEDIAALAGAPVAPHRFDPAGRTDLLGLPTGKYLTDWLSRREGQPVTTGVADSSVAILTYLERDMTAGWRGA
jgi:sulfide:quinone oxidoreductase